MCIKEEMFRKCFELLKKAIIVTTIFVYQLAEWEVQKNQDFVSVERKIMHALQNFYAKCLEYRMP